MLTTNLCSLSYEQNIKTLMAKYAILISNDGEKYKETQFNRHRVTSLYFWSISFKSINFVFFIQVS